MEMTPTDEIQYLKHVIELMQEQLDSRNNMITSLLQMQHPVMTSKDELKSIVKGAMSEWADSINIDQAPTQISQAEYPIVLEEYPYSAPKVLKYKQNIMNLNLPTEPSTAIPLSEIGNALGIEHPHTDKILKRAIKSLVNINKSLIQIPIDSDRLTKYHGLTKYLYYRK